MSTRHGGTKVKAGFYWSPSQWEIVPISGRDGGTLPGPADRHYLRIPVVAMLALAPVMGGLFVVFLPFLGFAMLARQAAAVGGRKLAWRARSRAVAKRRAAAAAASQAEGQASKRHVA